MAQNTDLNVSPYYDDYDETKNFHRILFRPSNAIQARELTQLQTILQNQVERFGSHVFDEGALVMGATTTINKTYYAVKVQDINPNALGTTTTETYRTAAIGKYYQGVDSGVVAKVINTAATSSTGDPLTLYVTYTKSGDGATANSAAETVFRDDEVIEEVALAAAGTYSNANNSNNEFKTINPNNVTGHDSATSTGSACTIRSGIIYSRGFFVRVDQQTILLDKYSDTPSYRIGLQITESLMSSTDDDTLLDNASGSTNENAPGANRLKIELTLVKKALTGTQDIDNFIELTRVETGNITKQTKITAYNVLERTLARRTYDESGDYIVKPFTLELREHLNTGQNNGIYLSTGDPIGSSTQMVAVLGSGKGYVKGFEIDKPSQTYKNIAKARETQSIGKDADGVSTGSGPSIPFNIGNYYNVTNCSGQPEFGAKDQTNATDLYTYGAINLNDTKIASAGADPGTTIGFARVRFFNYNAAASSPPSGSNHQSKLDSFFKLYLFDVRMFTEITFSGSNYALTTGQRVKGTVSGAKGTVATTTAHNATKLYLMDVEGTFSTADTIRLEHAASGGKGSVTAVKQFSNDDVRSLYQKTRYNVLNTATSRADFTADTVLTDNQYAVSGTVFVDQSDDADKLIGTNSAFTTELKVGDVVRFDNNTSGIIDEVPSNEEASLAADLGADYSGTLIRQRAQLQEQEKTVAISSTSKDFVTEINPNQYDVRKQVLMPVLAGDTIAKGAPQNSTFSTEDADDYIISIDHIGSAGSTKGAIAQIDEGAGTLVITDSSMTIDQTASTPIDADDQLKVTYRMQQSSIPVSTKNLKRARAVKVTTTATAVPASTNPSAEVYGTNLNDEIITLGVPDVYALRAVYESNDATEALPPKLTLTEPGGTNFAGSPGDTISGGTSEAIAKIIQVTGSTDVYFYYVTKDKSFVVGETITNDSQVANTTTNNRVLASTTEVSKDISNNWLLDDGQRDGYYSLASIKRKAGAPTPTKSLLIIFDAFQATAGNFFTVASYTPGIDFSNIPNYIPNITDPGGQEPDGEIELGDAIDYRSYVHSLINLSTDTSVSSITDISGITSQALAYATQDFDGDRAVTFDLPVSGQSLTTTDLTHYLPRIDKISLSSDGQFILSVGQSAEDPAAPATPANAILLHTLYIPAYTRDLGNISVQSQDHRRFTMKDIGRIQGRVKNLERVTSLNALEQQTSLHQVQDADGFDRFKSGFVTDNFRGHKTGDVNHSDYKIGVDRTTGTLRPMHNSRFVDLELNTGSSTGYQKTGDLITLPYSEETYVNIDKASVTEFVNPYDVVLFNGSVSLSPSRDLWFDTQRLPSVRRTVEGDYDTVLKGVGNALGTVWNNWQTDWVGEPVTTVEEPGNTGQTITNANPGRVARVATPAQRSKNIPGSKGGGGGGLNWNNIRFEQAMR